MQNNFVAFDIEVYPNYFLIVLKPNGEATKSLAIEVYGKDKTLTAEQRTKLINLFNKYQTYGFNTFNYDIPVLVAALAHYTTTEIFELSKLIINSGEPGWKVMKDKELENPKSFNTFDLFNIAPGVAGLKLYAARLHCHTLRELPYKFDTDLTVAQAKEVKAYCQNDIILTELLFNKLWPQIQLRYDISQKYKVDMRSKSDAQIAEAIIKSKLNVKKPQPAEAFSYNAPSFIEFSNPSLNKLLDTIKKLRFLIDAKGSVIVPNELKTAKYKTKFGTELQLGIGGLHSKEKSQHHVANGYKLIDADVASFYPSIILECELYPKGIGPQFLVVYQSLVEERLKAKREKNEVENASLKITINGSFGKLGSKYSVLYSPDLLLQVTITGQLSLLMLIEKLEALNINVVSANTDGIVAKITPNQQKAYNRACFEWQLDTGFELEFTEYKALYSRDVNNYFAVKLDGKIKTKGCYSIAELNKNPQADIIYESIIEYLTKGTPIVKTIKNCKDITKFLFVRKVNGGAVWNGEFIGSVVRWLYTTDGSTINYEKNNNKVPNSDGSMPIKILGDIPKKLDYDKYIAEANENLALLGLQF